MVKTAHERGTREEGERERDGEKYLGRFLEDSEH